MKISVITIVYNDVEHIESTMLSVVNQTAFSSIEYIVVDGASTDGTSDVIKLYADKVDKYVCEHDTGIYNAMNKGLRMATGDYVVFINSGDLFSDNRVIENIIEIAAETRPDLVYGNYREILNGNASKIIPCRSKDKIWYGPVASHQSTFYSLSNLRRNNLQYDESYRIAADYKLTAQVITAAKSVKKADLCISDFDVSGISSMNQNQGLKEANRVRREVLGWGAIRIAIVTTILLSARYLKRFMYPLYYIIRY